MGIVREPEIRDYWAQSPLLHYSPIAGKNRFEEISRYVHLVDNFALPRRGESGYHRLQKMNEVMDMVREHFKAIYNPNVSISVDESVIPFKGKYTIFAERVSVRQLLRVVFSVRTCRHT